MTETTHATNTLGVNDRRVPATILTGFLGSGKTTLLNKILAANNGLRIAIIVNELGDVGIDGGLIEQTAPDDMLELTAGCICCTIRGDLLAGLARILQRDNPPEYLIIETTGIADPLPIAQTFFIPGLQQMVRLDGIVTLADADQFFYHLASSMMVREQLEYANMIVLTKTDLVSPEQRAHVESAIRELNPYAPILHSANGAIDLRLLLDVGAFKVDDRFTAGAENWLTEEAAHDHAHHHDDDHDHGHLDAEDISTISFTTRAPFDMEKLQEFWTTLPANVFRGKGVLWLDENEMRCVFHQVGARVVVEAQRRWNADEERESRLVFIGTHLDGNAMRTHLAACTVAPAPR